MKNRELIFKALINSIYFDNKQVTIAYNFTESDGSIALFAADLNEPSGSHYGSFGGDEGNRTPVRKYIHTNFSEHSHWFILTKFNEQ